MKNQANNQKEVNSFTDLYVWQKAHKLVLEIYSYTKKFPEEEKFSLTNQLRRASVSITSNIAEGFSRSSKKEKIRFYLTSLGSLCEIQNQLLIARDLRYIDSSSFKKLADDTVEVNKMLNGLIKSANSRDKED